MLWVFFLTGLVLAGAEEATSKAETKSKGGPEVKQLVNGGRVNALVLGFDNRTVFAGSDDGFARYFSLEESKLVNEVYHGTLINCLALAKHGMILYTGSSDGYIRAWKLRDQTLITTMVVKERVFALTTDDEHIYGGGKARIITKFNIRKEIAFKETECCPEVGKWENIDELIFSLAVYDNYLLVGTGKGNVYAFEKGSPGGAPVAKYDHTTRVNGLGVRNDGMIYSAGGGHIAAMELQGAESEKSFVEKAIYRHASDAHMLHAVVVSAAAGNRFFSAGADGVVKVWKEGKNKPVAAINCGCRIFTLAVCGNGTTVLAGGMDGQIFAIDWQENDPVPRALMHGYSLHIRDRKMDEEWEAEQKKKEEEKEKEKEERRKMIEEKKKTIKSEYAAEL